MSFKFTPGRLLIGVVGIVALILCVVLYDGLKDKKEPVPGKLSWDYMGILYNKEEEPAVNWCRERNIQVCKLSWTLVRGQVNVLSYRLEKSGSYGVMLVWAEPKLFNGDVLLHYEYYDLKSSVMDLAAVKGCMPEAPESVLQGTLDLGRATRFKEWIAGEATRQGSGSQHYFEEWQIEAMKKRGEKNLSPRVIHLKMGALVPLRNPQRMYVINVKYVAESEEELKRDKSP